MTDFVHRPNVRYDASVRLVAEAVRRARLRGVEIAVTVVDATGRPLASGRMDDAPLWAAEESAKRAAAALSAEGRRRGNGAMRDGRQWRLGGVPVRTSGQLAGALGVAGATGPELDEALARETAAVLLEADARTGG